MVHKKKKQTNEQTKQQQQQQQQQCHSTIWRGQDVLLVCQGMP